MRLGRTSGAALTAEDAVEADADTIVTSTLNLGSAVPRRAVRPPAREPVRPAQRTVPFSRNRPVDSSPRSRFDLTTPLLYAPPDDGNSVRRGRHATAAGKADWAHHRAVPLFRQNRRVIIGAAITLVFVVIGISLPEWGESSASGKPCAPFYVGKQDSDLCADARGAVITDNLTVSATSLAATDNGIGGLSLCSDVTLTNNSGDKQNYSAVDFRIENPSGEMNSPTSGTLLHTAGTLAPGGTKTGTICHPSTAQTGLYAVIYQPSVLGARRGVWVSQR
jgi:hypothetical protein